MVLMVDCLCKDNVGGCREVILMVCIWRRWGQERERQRGVLILLLIIILPPLKAQLFRVSIVITKSLPWKKRTERKMEGKDKRICYTWLALFLVQKHFLHSFLLPACQLLATLLAPFDILIHISVWHEVTNMHCEVNRYGQRGSQI